MNPTAIPYLSHTWHPVTGCSPVGEGCRNCWSERESRGRLRKWYGGDHQVRLHPERLGEPLHLRKPATIGVCFRGDLFHDEVPEEFIAAVFGVIALCREHRFVLFTKRSARARDVITRMGHARLGTDLEHSTQSPEAACLAIAAQQLATEHDRALAGLWSNLKHTGAERGVVEWPLANVFLGVSCWDQASAEAMVPDLLATPAVHRVLSLEPLLGPVDLRRVGKADVLLGTRMERVGKFNAAGLYDDGDYTFPSVGVDWVIVGGESARPRHLARPMHPDWVRSLRDQCAAAGVPFWFKQWGESLRVEEAQDILGDDDPRLSDGQRRIGGRTALCMAGNDLFVRVGTKTAGDLLDGRQHHELPEVLR